MIFSLSRDFFQKVPIYKCVPLTTVHGFNATLVRSTKKKEKKKVDFFTRLQVIFIEYKSIFSVYQVASDFSAMGVPSVGKDYNILVYI